MDKTKELETSFNHAISITERKSIIISGVKRIDSFDNEEFLMETTLDTYQGNISIKGKIDSLGYFEGNAKKNKDDSILTKLFK